MFLLVLESDNFSPFILEVPFGVNCRANRLTRWGPSNTREAPGRSQKRQNRGW
jgi:hypothetical protein